MDVKVEFLRNFTRYVGVLIASLGAMVVSPQGVRWVGARVWSSKIVDWLRRTLARWIPRFRRDLVVDVADSAAILSSVVTITAGGSVSEPGVSLERQVEILRIRFEELAKDFGNLRDSLHAARRTLGDKLNDLESSLVGEIVALKDVLAAADQRAVETDARALPVVGLGVVLTGLADEIGGLPFWAWLAVVVVALLVTAWIVRWAWRAPARSTLDLK